MDHRYPSVSKLTLSVALVFICTMLNAQIIISSDTLSSSTSSKNANWADLMLDPNANFYDAQTAFYDYWTGKTPEKGKGYKVFQRWEALMIPRVYPTGDKSDFYKSSQEYSKYLDEHPDAKSTNGNWTCIGPGNPNGSATNGYQGPGGNGRVNCIAFHPTDPNTIYVGTPVGGLWKTTDKGVSWTCLTNQVANLGVSCIVVNPSDPNIIYIATGDHDAGDSYSVGILKTTDGGLTWNTTSFNVATSSRYRISKILMDPSNSNIMLASYNGGVYRTTDGWTSKTAVEPIAGYLWYDMEYKPTTNGATLYLAGCKSAAPNAGRANVYTSTDHGATFPTNVQLVTSGIQRVALAVSNNQSTYVWALLGRSSDYGLYGIYRSTNSGVAFSSIYGTTPNLLGWNTDFSDAGGQAFYDLTIAVNPSNANEIFVGGVNIAKSTNGGTAFTCNAYWLQGKPGFQYAHADHHAIEYYDNTTLYDGNDGGVFISTDNGANWTDISSNLAIAQIYRIGNAATNKNLIVAGMQDNGTNLIDNYNWTVIYGGDGVDCMIDYTNENIIYESYPYGSIKKSTDRGMSWSVIAPGSAGTGLWLTPYVMHPTDHNTIYAGYTEIWKSTDAGGSWTQLTAIGGAGKVSSLAVAASNPNYIYAIKDNAGACNVYRSSNGGSSWTPITGTLPVGSATPVCITASDLDPLKVWIAFSSYSAGNKVFYSSDAGANWTNISGTLPNIPTNTVVYDKTSGNNRVYVGMDVGVYYRDDGSSDWTLFSTGLPATKVDELEIFYDATTCETRLRAATYGRSVWESDLVNAYTLSYKSGTTTQNTEMVQQGSVKEQIIGIKVVMSKCGNAINLTNMQFNTTGTTNVADISNARLYYTGNIPTYSSSNPFGSVVAAPSGSFSFTGSQALAPDTNYFWLTYDISATATLDNYVDAQCSQYTIGGSTYYPTVTSPAGNRQIKDYGSSGTGSLASYMYGPILRDAANSAYDYCRYQYLITTAQMSAMGIVNGQKINKIRFNKTSAYTATGTASFKIYLKNSALSNLTTGTAWATVISGATNVYNNPAYSLYSTGGWIDFDFPGFTYTGGALEIATDWDVSGAIEPAFTGPIYWEYSTYAALYTIGIASATSNPTPLQQASFGGNLRPNMQFEWYTPSGCTQPTTQASAFSTPTVTNNSITVNWTRGNGTGGVIVVAKAGSAVNADPTSGTTYTANSVFGSGDLYGTGNYIVYNGTGTSVNITGLTKNTTYYFAIYEYNSSGTCYKIPALTGSATTYGVPIVTTTAISSITQTTASGGGNVTNNSGDAVTSRGVCWNTTGTPTIADSKTSDGSGNGVFTSSLTGLSVGTTYYVRAYATNAYGTAYGAAVTFCTKCGSISLPITENFNSPPTLNSCWTTLIKTGSSPSPAIKVTPYAYSNGVQYYYPSEGTDGAGCIDFNSFDCPSGAEIYLVTQPFSTVGYTVVTVNFKWLKFPGYNTNLDQMTLWYSTDGINFITTGAPTYTRYAATASWISYAPTLPAGALNQPVVYIGFLFKSLYGDDCSLDNVQITGTSSCTEPTTQATNFSVGLKTNTTMPISWTRGNGTNVLVIACQGSPVNSDPILGTSYTANTQFGLGTQIGNGNYVVYDGASSSPGVTVTGLQELTTYYFKVYEYNATKCYLMPGLSGSGTTYGKPTVTTSAITAIQGPQATGGGNVISDGGATTTRGVCWNTSGTPNIGDSKTTDGTGTGIYSSTITPLSASTLYHVRAYATNTYGTSYGSEVDFTSACASVSSYPYTQGFENGGTIPNCWAQSFVSGTINWTFINGSAESHPASSHGGSYNACFANKNVLGDATKLISPSFDLSSLTTPVLSFWHTQEIWGGEQDELRVYYKTSYGGSWTLLQTFTNSISDWTWESIALPNKSADYWIAFEGTAKYGYGICIDDITIGDCKKWTGTASTDWLNINNWNPVNAPTSSDNVYIPSGTPYQPHVTSAPASWAQCNSLTIASGASLTIDAGKALTASGNTRIYGSFTIESDATGTGSYKDNGTVTGTATVKKYLSISRWWYVGLPISTSITASCFGTISSGEIHLYYYSEPGHAYTQLNSSSVLDPAATPLRGYSLKNASNPINAVFTGSLSTGSIGGSTNLTYTSGSYSGYNLVCNPYPSAINWGCQNFPTSGLTMTNLSPTIWYNSNGNWATYNWTGNGTGANGGERHVPAMQAFWVEVLSGPTGGLHITNSAREHDPTPFYKENSESNILRIQVNRDTLKDEAVVGFYSGAINSYDLFDSKKMFASDSNYPQIFTLTTDSENVVINGFSELALGADLVVPLGFMTNIIGTFTLHTTNLEDFSPDVAVYLEDHVMEHVYDLRMDDTYNFTSGVVNDASRFLLHFNSITTGIENNNTFVDAYSYNKSIYVNCSESNCQIELYDMLGNLVLSKQCQKGLNILTANASKGIYIVKVVDGSDLMTKKLLIE